MYCPKCKSEYKEGITRCADCGVDLVAKLPIDKEKIGSNEGKEDQAEDFVLLINVANKVEADLLINLLKNNNIVGYIKDKMSGNYMNLYMGYSIYGQDIYVEAKNYKLAKEICSELYEHQIEDAEEEEQEKLPFYRNATIVSRMIVGVAVGLIALSWILTMIFD